MPRKRRRAIGRSGELTLPARLELLIGPGQTSEFEDDAERRLAWRRFRDELMGEVNPGTVPWGYDEYERGGAANGHARGA